MSRPCLCLVFLTCTLSLVHAETDYTTDIQPLFEEKCGACHSVLKQESGLRLDAGLFIRQGGDDGPVIDIDDPESSRLIQRITTREPGERMPPEEEGTPLTDEQVELVKSWIRAGAESPEDESIIASPQDHWAYQPPVKSPLPIPTESSAGESQPLNPIDAWFASKWNQQGLTPNPSADELTLLRRVHLDVTGLPPTLAEQDAFLADPSSEAWTRIVNRLIDDPAYGEKWGRHWMDIWRYSDWDGYKQELRGSQRHMWHWRDWIVESLNADQGYDEMIREMLAGDEIASDDPERLRATGFLVRNFHTSNRDIWLDATVEHTAKAFLAMTIACAKCHDHKYDPISQHEYYAFRAIFEPHRVRTERLSGEADINKQGLPRAYDADLDIATYLYRRGNEKDPDKDHPIEANVPKIVSVPFVVEPVTLTVQATHPFLRDYIESEDLAVEQKKLETARAELTKADSDHKTEAKQTVDVAELRLKSLQLRWAATKQRLGNPTPDANPQSNPVAEEAAIAERTLKVQQSLLSVLQKRTLLETAKAAAETDEAKKTAAIQAGEKALAAAERQLIDASLETLTTGDQFTPLGTSYPATSSGRRRALAEWITHRENPLTARVAVNHLWLRYFGEPLVENVADFGLRSPRPPHHELLDWLAVELMEHDWSLKHIERLILTSRVYRLSSNTDELAETVFDKNQQLDPDNRGLWRANVRRLDAELVRDSLLAVGGSLDRTMGGQDIDFHLGETISRRSLYFRHAYEKQMRMLVIFDAANPSDCYRRSESVIPQQALALANSPLAHDQSRRLAKRLGDEASDDKGFIELAYRTVLGRPASVDETTACVQFLQQQSDLLMQSDSLELIDGKAETRIPPAETPSLRARENLVHVLFNHNDFVTLR